MELIVVHYQLIGFDIVFSIIPCENITPSEFLSDENLNDKT